MNHLERGKWESLKTVPAVTENWWRHDSALHSKSLRVSIREIEVPPHFGHSGPSGQRKSSRNARHLSSSPNCSKSLGRFIAGFSTTGALLCLGDQRGRAS